MNINLYVFPVKEHIIFIRRAGFSFFLDTCGKFIFRFNRCYWSEVLVLGYFLLWFCQNEPGKEEMEGGREETCECYLLLGTWYFILCHPLFLPSIFPTIKVFSSESALLIRWPKYWNFSFSISLSNEYPGLISFRIDWFYLLAVQGTPKSLLQHHSSKASVLWHPAFFMILLSHPYMTLEKPKLWLDGPLSA